jgi:hypothetical protein
MIHLSNDYTITQDGKVEKRKRNKFNARKVTDSANITHDSKFESQVYQERLQQEQAGEITGLKLQVRFTLQEAFRDRAGKKHRAITWRADFIYIENGVNVAEDAKGYLTEASGIRHKLFARHYPDWILRVTKKDGRR